jgi:hypothetical protein
MKSHVGMGYSLCPICYEKHDEVVLLQQQPVAPPRLEHDNFMGFDLCPKHKEQTHEFMGLVEVEGTPNGNLKPEDVKPTGNYAMLKRAVVDRVFNVKIAPTIPFVYVEVGVLDKLKAAQQP